MSIGTRVREMRKTLGLNTTEFGDKIGVSNAAVSMMERNINGMSERSIRAIVREFGANEEWLRTGNGEMFVSTAFHERIAAFMGDVLRDEDSFRLRLIATLATMPSDEWALLERRFMEVAGHEKSRP